MLQEVEYRKRRLSEEILQEKRLLEKLKENDPSWNSFVNKLNNLNNEPQIDILDRKRYLRLKEELADYNYFERIKEKLDTIPDSNGSKYFQKIDVQVSIISDEFLFNSFVGTSNLTYVKPNNYLETVENADILIVASTWRGLDNEWKGLGTINSEKREVLKKVIKEYQKRDIPVVFYNKEDPVNFDRFISIAKMCDYIFTTAIEKVNEYKEICGHSNVYVIEFAANPLYHNPIGMNIYKKDNSVLFAGSWYAKYPHRQKDTRMIFDGIIESGNGLKIIDRNFNLNIMDYSFPEKYLKYISPAIPHKYVQKLHKLFLWAINLNSVQNSETMFANRVYELQAMGNLILSNYSLGINNLFPNINIVNNKDEISFIMNNISQREIYMHQIYGIRKVLREDTTYHRLDFILNKVGLRKNYIVEKKVAVVTDDKSNTNIIEKFERQSISNVELIEINELDSRYDEFNFITFFHPDYDYGEYYLEDLLNGFKYTNSSFITKDSYYRDGEYQEGIEHNFVNVIKDKYRTMFDINDFGVDSLRNMNLPLEVNNGYSIDSTELDISSTTSFNIDSELKLSVIIPIYNNGEHLYGKCFMSLRRSSIFDNMDIILVDDGSTDEQTLMIVDRLTRLYSNVQSYKFNDNGSGSASRPRNKGIELAKTNLITYLDPDNEAVNDGYALLLKEIQNKPELDLVVGDIIKIDTKERVMNYSKHVYKENNNGIIQNTREFLKKSNLRAQSIQALIVKKEIITRNNLQMVENAVGQDTLFFQQLILNSNKFKAVRTIIHLYYAAVSNSVTNTISKKFFERYLILEKERYNFLVEERLLQHYLEKRFVPYFEGWYLVRIPRVSEESLEGSLKVLEQIYKLYEPKIENKKDSLLKFEKTMRNQDYKNFVTYCQDNFVKN